MARIRSSVLWFVPHQHSSQSLPVVFLLPHQSRLAGFCVFFFFLQWRSTGEGVSPLCSLRWPAAATTTTRSSGTGVNEGLTAALKPVWVWQRQVNLWPSKLVLKWMPNGISTEVATPAMSQFEVGMVQRCGQPWCSPSFHWRWVKAVHCVVCCVVQVIFMCQFHVMQTILR